MEKIATKVWGVVAHNPPDLKIGMGDPKVECESCSEVHVFARLSGASYTSYRTIVPKDTSIGTLKGIFEGVHGTRISQDCLVDENGYTFANQLLDQPVWKFSNKCRLHIDFTHSEGAVIGSAKNIRGKTDVTEIMNLYSFLFLLLLFQEGQHFVYGSGYLGTGTKNGSDSSRLEKIIV